MAQSSEEQLASMRGTSLHMMDRANDTGDVTLQVDLSPAYDLLQSLHFVAPPRRKGRWVEWAKEVAGEMSDAQWKGICRWFGGDPSVGTVYTALIPLLPQPHTIEDLLDKIAELSVADFLRITCTANPTDPEAPLGTDDLLALQANHTSAQQFVDRYLRVTGRQRTHLLQILARPKEALAELLAILRLYNEKIYMRIEPKVRDERARAAVRLQEMVQTASLPKWISRAYDVHGFTPVVLAPSVFRDTSISVYVHEIQQPLLDKSTFEPLILIIGTQSILDTTLQRLGILASDTKLSDPADRWSRVFSMLADPSRLRLLHLLAERPYYEQELAAALDISGATISHHLNMLVRAGLVRLERQAHRTYVVLQRETFTTLLSESQRYVLRTPLSNKEKE